MGNDRIDLSEILLIDSQNKWELFIAASTSAGIEPPKNQALISIMKRIFVFSDFIARGLTRKPELLQALIESGDLKRRYDSGEYLKAYSLST